MESADTLVGQKSAFIKHKSVCNPVVNIEHTRNGAHEHIHTCADNGHENAFLLQTSDDFSGTRHQLNTGVRSKDLVLVDGVLHGFPHLNVRAHELNVADLSPDKPIQVQTVVRTKGIVERSPRAYRINQDTVTVEHDDIGSFRNFRHGTTWVKPYESLRFQPSTGPSNRPWMGGMVPPTARVPPRWAPAIAGGVGSASDLKPSCRSSSHPKLGAALRLR